jgi:hypothetical protein
MTNENRGMIQKENENLLREEKGIKSRRWMNSRLKDPTPRIEKILIGIMLISRKYPNEKIRDIGLTAQGSD